MTSVECPAQVARYQPRTPTTSPYLNLTRFNGGGAINHFGLVRQREFNLQEQALRLEQERQLIRLQNEVTRGLEPNSITGTGSWFRSPGTRQHFYPELTFRGVRR